MIEPVVGVPRAELAEHWREVAPLVQRMIDRDWGDRYSLDGIYSALAEGALQLWRWRSMIMLTELRETPAGKECLIFGGAGRLEEGWQEIMDAIVQTSGCDWALVYARPGFERPLRAAGWRKRQVGMTRPIAKEHLERH